MEKIEVFAESNSVAIHVATFHSDELYNKCLTLIEGHYKDCTITESVVTLTAVEEAKQVLKQAGYYVDNLWRVEDVYDNYTICDAELSQKILNAALTNDATMEQIQMSIRIGYEMYCGNEDLFEYYDALPDEVKAIIDKHSNDDNTYETCGALQEELEEVGYTCEFGLDATPFNLKKI